MTRKLLQTIAIVIFTTIIFDSVQSQSFYSTRGIGLVRDFVSGQSAGMGGVGIAIADPFSVNYLNPAALVELPFTFISGSFAHEFADLHGRTQDATISNSNVIGFQFVVPIKKQKAVIALGLSPYSTIEYSFAADGQQGEDKTFTEIISGDGGVNTGFFTLALRPHERLSVGLSGLLYFGVLRNIWQVIFISDNFFNTQTEVAHNFAVGGIRAGMQLKILPNWTIGGVIAPSVNLNATQSTTLVNITRFEDTGQRELMIPLAYGIGTAINLSRKLTVGLDYYTQKWTDFSSDGFVNDSRRIAFGLEFSGRGKIRDPYFSKVAFRIGGFYRDLGLEEPAGEKVTEIFGSIGLGMPIKWSNGRIDLSLEGGRRGSKTKNPFRETVIRFSASATVGERWFFRSRRE